MIKRLLNRYWVHIFTNRRPFRLTRGGWVFILYTIGVGAGAINTGNNLLYLVFGIFLGVILASGVLSDLSLWKVRASFQFPESAQIGQPNVIQVRLKNDKKWFPSLSLTLELEGDIRGEPVLVKKFIPAIYPGETYRTHVILYPVNRGWFQVHRLRFTTRFPFGLLFKWWTYRIQKEETKSVPLDSSQGVVVYPEAIDLSTSETLIRTLGDEQAPIMGRRGDGSTIYGLRDFRSNDNHRRIHWKSSAKRGFSTADNPNGWLIREMEADEKSEMHFWWPKPSYFKELNEAQIETLIQFTISLFQSFHEEGRNSRLLIPGEYGKGRIDSYRLQSPLGGDEHKAVLEFLSLFDGEYPVNPISQSYLKPDPQIWKGSSYVKPHLIAELFEKWQKSNETKAA